MTDVPRPATPLSDELKTVLAALEHARRALSKDDIPDAGGLWASLDRCARRLETLDRHQRDGVKPIMLALLDELERTIAVFGAEHRHLGDKLKSASRSMAAGAAYRQTPGR